MNPIYIYQHFLRKEVAGEQSYHGILFAFFLLKNIHSYEKFFFFSLASIYEKSSRFFIIDTIVTFLREN